MDGVIRIDVGDGAIHAIVDPRSFSSGGVEWRLRYSMDDAAKLPAAELISSFDYLLSGSITTTEAMRRLRILRKARESGPDTKTANIHEYLQGIREGWSIDRWRLFADTNMKDTDHAR